MRAKVEKTSGDQNKEPTCLKVHNGTKMNEEEEKKYKNVGFVIIVDSNRDLSSICSGYLIRPDVVLTAQHCVADESQNAFEPESLLFSLHDLPDIISARNNRQPLLDRSVTEVIQWAEVGQNYRDVALLRLSQPYDERFLPAGIMQNRFETVGSEIVVAGFGNSMDKNDAATFQYGIRKIGRTKFKEYTTLLEFPDFENTDFVEEADYLVIETTEKDQMICQGDSGSSAFADFGAFRSIVGVTSMQDSAGETKEQLCANSREGLYVPSDKIRSWIDMKLKEIDAKYALESYSLLKAEVTSIKKSSKFSNVNVKVLEHYDNGLEIDGETVDLKICLDKTCPVLPKIQADITEGSVVSLKVVKDGADFYIERAALDNTVSRYSVEFNATIDSAESSQSIFDRVEKGFFLKYADAINESEESPRVFSEMALAKFCIQGCSKNSEIITRNFQMKVGKGVKVKADVIEGELYIREVSANTDYDLDKVDLTRSKLGISGVPFAAKKCEFK